MNIKCGNCGSIKYNQNDGYCMECFCQPLNHVQFEETNNFEQFNDYINFKAETTSSHSKIYRLNKILDTVSKKNDIIFPSQFYEQINKYLLEFCEFFFGNKTRKNFPFYQQIINYFCKNHHYPEYAPFFKKCTTYKIRLANHIILREFEQILNK